MNSKLERFIKSVNGKHVMLLGIGVSNKPLIKQLLSYGAHVTCCDKNSEIESDFLDEMKLGARFRLGEHYLDKLDCDMIFKTPGIRHDLPQLLEAKSRGIVITSEMEVFVKICPCEIIGVTGSDGKTTTTTLIHNILSEEGYTCHLGGNIGKPLLPEIEAITENDMAVVEMSSFQLMTMKKSPDIAVVTNISPNHLDVHKSFDEYVEAKKNIFRHQNKSGVLVINANNDITASFAGEAKGEVIYFGGDGTGVYQQDGDICFDNKKMISVSDIALPGKHNVENYMAAIAACGKRTNPKSIKKVAKSFKGVEHRIEFVKEIDGISFYNDSIASTPSRARASLYSFDRKVVLIAGGYDKKISFDEFGRDVRERVKRLYLFGATAPAIRKAVLKAFEGRRPIPIITQYITLEQIVKEAYMAAEAGDIVLLSPACASFDMFKNFEERGNLFKELVRKL
jgi:UDP-N-acetylmuramoylalanine--D-glutamate ligase